MHEPIELSVQSSWLREVIVADSFVHATADSRSQQRVIGSQQRVISNLPEPITSTSPFVTTSGTSFVLDGKPIYPSGTSW